MAMEPYAHFQQPQSAGSYSQHPHPQAQQSQAAPTMQQPPQSYAQHQPAPQMAGQHMMMQPTYANSAYTMPPPYGIATSQAAAIATAAASGYPAPYPMSDPSMPGPLHRTSPRSQQVETDSTSAARPNPQSPRQLNVTGSMPGQMPMSSAQSMAGGISAQMQQAQRRMSHSMNGGGVPSQPNASVMSSRGPVPPHGPPVQAPQPAADGAAEESPLYVNAKQFHRILKRRMARQRLEEALRLTSKGRKPYLHESRHNHAMRRPRGPGGRFLTADEVLQMEAKGEGGVSVNGDSSGAHQDNGLTTNGGALKRKAKDKLKGGSPNKRAASEENSNGDGEDDEV